MRADADLARARWRRISASGIEPNRFWPENMTEPDREQIAACRAWLREFAIATAAIRRRRSSYAYKHDVEDWARANEHALYVSNGAFIVAAIAEGVRVERAIEAGLNAVFAFRVRRPNEVNLARTGADA
jgi:hypothetical protein